MGVGDVRYQLLNHKPKPWVSCKEQKLGMSGTRRKDELQGPSVLGSGPAPTWGWGSVAVARPGSSGPPG